MNRRRLVALVTATVLMLTATATSASALATDQVVSTSSPQNVMVESDDAAAVNLGIENISPQVLQLGQDLSVQVSVTNTSAATISTAQVALGVSAYRLSTRLEIERWLDGSSPLTTAPIGRSTVDELLPGQTVELTVVASAAVIELANVWGPRGLIVSFTSADVFVSKRTFLLWQSNETIPQAQVALLAPVVGSAVDAELPKLRATTTTASPAPTAQNYSQVQTLVEPEGRLGQLLAAARAVPELGLAVDPQLLEIAAEDDDSLTSSWLSGLRSALHDGRQGIVLPWADPDLPTLAAGSGTPLLQTASGLAQQAEPDLTASWAVAADPLDQFTADMLTQSGITHVVAPAPQPTAGSNSTTTSTATTGMVTTGSGALTVVQSDPLLSAVFADTTRSAAENEQLALTLLAIAARSADKQVLISASRDWIADLPRTSSFLEALRLSPWVTLTSAENFTAVGTPQLLGTTPSGHISGPAVANLIETRADLQAFSQVTGEPAVVTAGVDVTAGSLLSYAWRADPDTQTDLLDDFRQDLTKRRGAISLVPPRPVLGVSSNSALRVTVRNDLPVDAEVQIRLDPKRGCLQEATSQVVTIPANADSAVSVPLIAHSNCQVTVEVWLLGAEGELISTQPAEFDAMVSPDVEDVGTMVVAALLFIALVAGLIRTVRRGRRTHSVTESVPVEPVD